MLSSSRGRTRTCDPLINSQLLYQLSYSGRIVAGVESHYQLPTWSSGIAAGLRPECNHAEG